MKTKAKLLLAISTLSAVVLAAGVTSTFAWFTTRSSVQFDAGTLTVSTMSKLTITGMRVVSGASTADSGATPTKVVAQNSPLGSVSSATGEHFFAETEIGKTTGFTAIDDQDAVNGLKAGNNKLCDYLKYNFKISAEAADDGSKDLYVGLDAPAITGTHIADWYRVAIYTYTDTDSTLDDDPQTANTVFAKTYATANGGNKREDGNVIVDAVGGTGSATREKITDLTGDAGTGNAGTGVVLKSGFQTATAPSTHVDAASIFVSVAIWMEGTAATNQNDAGGETLQLDFNFSLLPAA